MDRVIEKLLLHNTYISVLLLQLSSPGTVLSEGISSRLGVLAVRWKLAIDLGVVAEMKG